MSTLHEQNEFLTMHKGKWPHDMTSLREGTFILPPRGGERREALGQGLGGEGVRRRY